LFECNCSVFPVPKVFAWCFSVPGLCRSPVIYWNFCVSSSQALCKWF
jgi:hypothetical protein